MGGVSEAAVFIVAVIIAGSIPLAALFAFYKVKTRRFDALVKMAEIGGNIDPELFSSLGASEKTYKDDYRKALIWTALGIPILIGGGLEEGSLSGTILLSMPLCLGIAFYLSGKLRLRDRND